MQVTMGRSMASSGVTTMIVTGDDLGAACTGRIHAERRGGEARTDRIHTERRGGEADPRRGSPGKQFRVLLFGFGSGAATALRPPLDRLIADFFDRAITGGAPAPGPRHASYRPSGEAFQSPSQRHRCHRRSSWVPSSSDTWSGSVKSMAAERVRGGGQGNRRAERRRRPVARRDPTAECAPMCDDATGRSVPSQVRMSRPRHASGCDVRIHRGCVLDIV
jgi:hypothetical protein